LTLSSLWTPRTRSQGTWKLQSSLHSANSAHLLFEKDPTQTEESRSVNLVPGLHTHGSSEQRRTPRGSATFRSFGPEGREERPADSPSKFFAALDDCRPQLRPARGLSSKIPESALACSMRARRSCWGSGSASSISFAAMLTLSDITWVSRAISSIALSGTITAGVAHDGESPLVARGLDGIPNREGRRPI
jgi:hypothetical protein